MQFVLLLLISIFMSSAFADQILRIENIDNGYKATDYPHIYFEDGRIGVLKNSQYTSELKVGQTVKVDLASDHTIISIKPAKSPREGEVYLESENEMQSYEPTILEDLGKVDAIFKKMNRGWQSDSQCYNRAHIWNYEEFKRSGLLSKKVFIFFTRRYIRNYNFYWWFHAIPTVLAQDNGSIVERALDPRFVRKPLPMKTWSDVFVRSKRECPVITKYSTYVNNQESEHCYLHYSSMYYWQPRDLDKFERTGFEKKNFISSEVNWAYREAF